MKTLLKSSVGIAALLTGAGLALAQDGGATQNQQMAADITCAQIVVLDQQEAERALYFLAGYRAAQQDMGTQTDTTASATQGTTGGAEVTTGTGTDTAAAADTGETGAEMETDTTASAETGAGTDAMADTDTTASADTGADTDVEMDTDTTASADTGEADANIGTDTTTTAGTSAESGAAGQDSQMFAASGYFDIPVEGVITACREAPESRASDVLGQQSGSAQ